MTTSAGAIRDFHCPTRIIHGLGSNELLGAEVNNLGGRHAVFITDPGIVASGLLTVSQTSLAKAGISCSVFDSIGHDAQVGAVDRAAAFCRQEKADVVIAIGGGSALAAGRAAAAIATNGGSLGDHQGEARLDSPPLPVIAIPTTAGSGSEVSAAVPYFDDKRGRKTGTRSTHFFPRVAILDGTLLQTLPKHQAVHSGVDALTHAMEAFLTVRATPITDALALQAIRLLAANLRAAIMTSDLPARQQALVGSTMANLACGNAKLGLAHLLNRPVNTLFPKVPYGESIGILLTPVMTFNLPADLERFAQMADAFGETTSGHSLRDRAELCLQSLKRLLADLEASRCYPDDLVDRDRIEEMASMCAGGMHGGMKPAETPTTVIVNSFNRRQATVGDVINLYERAFQGWDL